jgi:AcrR family transcriptional regulator
MKARSYVSPLRAAGAEETRRVLIQAATNYLDEQPITKFSLDAVAKAAGVTRLTVYNQFGSRRGLLEAVLDEIATTGRVARVREAVESPDPTKGIERLVDIMCDFWESCPAIVRLHEASSLDPEFGAAIVERQELRRQAVGVLVKRASGKGALTAAHRAAIDLVSSLTSLPTYKTLAATQSSKAIRRLLKDACNDAVKRAIRSAT